MSPDACFLWFNIPSCRMMWIGRGIYLKLNNKFIVIWWGLVLISLIGLLCIRYSHFINNEITLFDYLLMLMLVIFIIYPLIYEMNIFGFSIKKDINKIESSVNDLKWLISNNNKNEQTNNYHFPESSFVSPEKMTHLSKGSDSLSDSAKSDEDRIKTIMYIRYKLEKELRRISIDLFGMNENIRVFLILRNLIERSYLKKEDYNIIMEIYSLTSKVIHGGEITNTEEQFVLSVHEEEIEKLKNIN